MADGVMIFKYDEKHTRVRTLADDNIDVYTPLLDPDDSRPAVTVTATGLIEKTVSTSDDPQLVVLGGRVTSITYEDGSPGHEDDEATLAYDGTFEFDVVSTGTTPAPTSTANGVAVYIKSDGGLTLVSSGNTLYGYVDYPTDYYKRAGRLPVRIGS